MAYSIKGEGVTSWLMQVYEATNAVGHDHKPNIVETVTLKNELEYTNRIFRNLESVRARLMCT
jgi:hypothetical protein